MKHPVIVEDDGVTGSEYLHNATGRILRQTQQSAHTPVILRYFVRWNRQRCTHTIINPHTIDVAEFIQRDNWKLGNQVDITGEVSAEYLSISSQCIKCLRILGA